MALVLMLAACGGGDGDDIDSDTEARWAYLGFDRAVDKAINLGFDGFNAASSANIPDQPDVGDETGTIVVSGQVDQGASANKQMRLELTLVDYFDGDFIDVDSDSDEERSVEYDTDEGDPLQLDISLRNIPDGTFSGSLTGNAFFSGDIDGEATFALTLAGEIMAGPDDTVLRTPGTLTITGQVSSGDGSYDVQLSR